MLRAAAEGQTGPLGDLLQSYRARLDRVISLRMDPRLARRADASDVIQEALVEVAARLPDYVEREELPFYLWVRFLAVQKLLQFHRRHLGAQARDVNRERHLHGGNESGVTSVVFARELLAATPSPSGAIRREEKRLKLEQALDAVDPADRDVLALRHFEGLTNGETARVLGVTDSAASQRYYRAAERLAEILTSLGEGPHPD